MQTILSLLTYLVFFLKENLTLIGILVFIRLVFFNKSEKLFGYNKNNLEKAEVNRFENVKRLLNSFANVISWCYFNGISLLLFMEGYIDLTLLLLIIFLESKSIIFTNRVLERASSKVLILYSFLSGLLLSSTAMYALLTVEFFKENSEIQYIFFAVYSLYFFRSVKRVKLVINYLKTFDDKQEAHSILMKLKPGTVASFLPLAFLLNNGFVSSFFIVVGIYNVIFTKEPLNFGMIDSRNRASVISFNNDSSNQVIAFSVAASLLVSEWFSLHSLFLFSSVMALWPFLRYSPSKLTKYNAVVIGEQYGVFKTSIYDNLLVRILPEFKRDFISRLHLKKSEYSFSFIFHNQKKIWDKKRGVLEMKDFVKESNHFMYLYDRGNSALNIVGEYDLINALRSPVIIIDIWPCTFQVETMFGKVDGDFAWNIRRLDLIIKLSDEDLAPNHSAKSENADGTYLKHVSDNLAVHQTIINSSSFESLRQNIQLFENQYNETDHERINQLTGRGIYELNTLFRQLHESPSIPSRFIDLLNVAECMIRYLVGFIHSERISDYVVIDNELSFDTKAIAFGSCADFLARWKKTNSVNATILGNRISNLLDVVYEDEENVESLISFIRLMNPGVSAKYSKKPTLMELSWWLVTIRNKTRGHGTPSKVDYKFYVCLEKTVLFMLAECSKLELNPSYISDVDGQKWTFNLSSGGYPEPVPVVKELQKGVHFNPMLEDDEIVRISENHKRITTNIPEGDDSLFIYVTDGETHEWWRSKRHFLIKDGILHLLNQRDEKKESWISFSTGRIVRPEISEI
jgi:hypothetical protein